MKGYARICIDPSMLETRVMRVGVMPEEGKKKTLQSERSKERR
jgi:hypothetical protein